MRPSAWPCTRTGCANSLAWVRAGSLLKPHTIVSNFRASVQIRVGDVLLYHSLRVEEGPIDGDGVLHNFQEFRAIVVVHRENHTFQLAIERFRFRRVVSRSVARSCASFFPDAPARDAFDVAFQPPTVNEAHA